MASVTEIPQSLRAIAHYVKIGGENANRDPIVNYWCLFYAVQTGMSIDKKSPEALQYLTSLLSTLENMKKQLGGQEAVTQDMVAQAHIENFAMKLFEYADKNDRQSNFTKGVIRAFYTAGHLIDVLTLFGELDENLLATRKYAKWKATYIHNCLKNGETPKAGPIGGQDDEVQNFNLEVPQNPVAGTGGAHPSITGGSTRSYIPPSNPTEPHIPPERPTAAPRMLPEGAAVGGISEMSYQPEAADKPRQEISGNDGSGLTLDDFMEAQKHAKYAVSALSYEDSKTAIESLTKALAILQKK